MWAIFLSILVFTLDFFSKSWVHSNVSPIRGIYPYNGIGVFENFLGIQFSIVHATNKGAAWGILAQWQEWLVYFRIVIILALLLYAVRSKDKSWSIPIALIITGAIGNLVDYFVYGHVIDMFFFTFWGYQYPVFNIADSSIFVGIFWVILASYCSKAKEQNEF